MKVLINRDKTFVGAVNKNSLHQSTKLDRGFITTVYSQVLQMLAVRQN